MSSEDNKEHKKDTDQVRKALSQVIDRLEPGGEARAEWRTAVGSNRERWNRLKGDIHDRQVLLKELVRQKRAGEIGEAEFESRYRSLQDELTDLEFEFYSMRLGLDLE
ncbi:MAG: hypothetical protein QXS20_04025 [Candidatus Thorarchaeota archaeon]